MKENKCYIRTQHYFNQLKREIIICSRYVWKRTFDNYLIVDVAFDMLYFSSCFDLHVHLIVIKYIECRIIGDRFYQAFLHMFLINIVYKKANIHNKKYSPIFVIIVINC